MYACTQYINPLNAELNPICHLLALLGAHHIFHVNVLRVNVTQHKPEAGVYDFISSPPTLPEPS
jgi:hypothetical protein